MVSAGTEYSLQKSKNMIRKVAVIIAIFLATLVIVATNNEQPKPTTSKSKVTSHVHAKAINTPKPRKTHTSRHKALRKPHKASKQVKKQTVHRTKNLDLRNMDLWILIHKCEGSWTDNSNFEGGLQFLHSTWVSAGGRAFAEHAYQATPEEQITVANWYSHGGSWLAPWPTCGKRAAAKLGMKFP